MKKSRVRRAGGLAGAALKRRGNRWRSQGCDSEGEWDLAGRAPPRMMKRRRGRMASDEGDLNRRRQRHCQLPSVCTPAAGKSPVAILSLMCECVRGDRGERGRKGARHRHAASTTPPRWNRDDDTDADGTAVPLSEAVSCLPADDNRARPPRPTTTRPSGATLARGHLSCSISA